MYLAASSAPFWFDNCSAWSRTGRPFAWAAVKTRSTSLGVKAMVSQKASTLVASFSRAAARDQLVGDHRDIILAAILILRRKRVEREQGRYDPHRLARGECRGASQQAKLDLEVERIARLDLDRGTPPFISASSRSAAVASSSIVGRRLRRLHRRGDAAAGPGDLLIGRAGAAHRMLVGAGAAENQMRVAVDEARRDPGAAERNHFPGAESGELGALADADDAAVL